MFNLRPSNLSHAAIPVDRAKGLGLAIWRMRSLCSNLSPWTCLLKLLIKRDCGLDMVQSLRIRGPRQWSHFHSHVLTLSYQENGEPKRGDRGWRSACVQFYLPPILKVCTARH
jgi:hypothetical protein